MTWDTVRLGELVAPVARKGPAGGRRTFTYVDLSSVDSVSKRIVAPAEVAVDDAPSRARQSLRTGDVLVSTVRPNLNGVAVVESHLNGAIGSTGFAVLRADVGRLDHRYLFHWVRTQQFIEAMTRVATGASYPAVSDALVKSSHIPLPPLPEQRRIAAILDEADALRVRREKSTVLLEELRFELVRSHMVRSQARRVRIGDLATVRSGSTPPRSDPSHFSGTTCWLKTGEVRRRIRTTSEHVSARGIAAARLQVFPAGSVVIAMYGQGATRGKSGILDIEATVNQACAVIPASEAFEPTVLQVQLEMAYQELRNSAEGVSQLNLSLARVADFEVAIPSLDSQRHLARELGKLDGQLETASDQLGDATALFASLRHRAFRGEL